MLIPTIYQDDSLAVVHKPAGIFVHRGRGCGKDDFFLLQAVRDQLGTFIYPVHRLDRATSGLVLFALSSAVAGKLQSAWRLGQVKKTYQAIVRGWMPASQGVCEEALDDPDSGRLQEAITTWQVLEQCELPLPVSRYATARYSLLELKPQTGRWHQLRRHMSRLQHPIAGDTSHGDRHHNHLLRDRLGWQRLLLAAVRLEFPHPVAGSVITCEDSQERGLFPYWEKLNGCRQCRTIVFANGNQEPE